MYKEVNAELARLGWNIKILSIKTGIRYSTLVTKMRGETPLKLDECIAIKSAIGSTLPLETLFAHQ